MKNDIIVVITTGRPSICKKTLKTLQDNRAKFDSPGFDVLISYDLDFKAASRSDYEEIGAECLDGSGSLVLAGNGYSGAFHEIPKTAWEQLSKLCDKKGYGRNKNACMLYALLKGYKKIIFWDDDEYATCLVGRNEKNIWLATDIFTPHRTSDADVTFGFWTGYVSPIPRSFITDTSLDLRKNLTLAMRDTTDVVTDHTFLEKSESFAVLLGKPKGKTEIEAVRGGKWISGGNLGICVDAIRDGRIPPFFLPAAGRGEDSIFSTDILDCRVEEVPAGIFHDAFGAYLSVEIQDGKEAPPESPLSETVLRVRFAQVLKGWIGYSALLTRITHPLSYADLLRHSLEAFKACDAELKRYFFNFAEFGDASAYLSAAICDVDTEYIRHRREALVWRNIISSISQPH